MVLASHETLGRQGQNLIHLFVAICLEAPHGLTTEEIQSVMDSLGEKALSAVLRAFAHRLNGTPEERARAWNDKIKPWLQEYWPSAGARNTTATSEAMLELIVECGDAFPDAVCWSRHYLRPIRGFSLFRLEKNEHAESHPDFALRTLKILVGDGGLLDNKYTLRKILDALGHNVPAMKADPDFRNLPYSRTIWLSFLSQGDLGMPSFGDSRIDDPVAAACRSIVQCSPAPLPSSAPGVP